jgi:Domain of unknown function (DUF4893)
MNARRLLLATALAALSAGCSMVRSGQIVEPGVRAQGWRGSITDADLKRLRDWRTAFVEGLRQANASGHSAQIANEGALLQPDAALPGPSLPNGAYRCRITKLGSRSASGPTYTPYPAFGCRIEALPGGGQSLAKMTGSQRPVGYLYGGDPMRLVLLGTMVLGDETRALRYGSDSERDIAGYVERIGPARWRVLLPSPQFESVMDVVELVPG